MHLTSRQEFSAPPADVHAMLTDEAFLAAAAQAMGATEHRTAASASRTAVEAVVPTPVEVRLFAGPTVRVTQESTWGQSAADGSREGTFRISVERAPVDLAGTMRLAPTASGSKVDYTGELTVSLPVVGPTVERAAAPIILDALTTQERVARTWLGRAR